MWLMFKPTASHRAHHIKISRSSLGFEYPAHPLPYDVHLPSRALLRHGRWATAAENGLYWRWPSVNGWGAATSSHQWWRTTTTKRHRHANNTNSKWVHSGGRGRNCPSPGHRRVHPRHRLTCLLYPWVFYHLAWARAITAIVG